MVLVVFASCKKDSTPTYDVSAVTVNTDNYTMGGTVVAKFSTDGGVTFGSTMPVGITEGSVLTVKLNNGTKDLIAANFTFDWSTSSLTADNPAGDVVKFTVSKGFTISVKVTDKMLLITSNRTTGEFFSLDVATGAATSLFTALDTVGNLVGVRGFTYNYTNGKYYVSQTSNEGGNLYSIDPVTKQSTKINDNDGRDGAAIWDAVVNWTVVGDSLIGYGDFNGDGNGFYKFGLNGGRAATLAVSDNLCCGLGMIFDVPNHTVLMANGSNSNDGEIIFDNVDFDGTDVPTATINTFENFSVDLSATWIVMKALANYNGEMYGILYDGDNYISYLVKVNLTTLKITNIATIGADEANQCNVLYSLPKYAL